MSKSWTNILLTDIDEESPVTEGLLEDFWDNQEALISGPIDTRFDAAATSGSPGSYTEIARREIYLPPCAASTGGDITFPVRIEVYADGSTTIDVRVRIGTGTYVEITGITDASWTFKTFTISDADVNANADSLVDLVVECRITSGSGEGHARCRSSSSRLERAA